MSQFRRALVTGGAGFIGSHIVDELIRQDCEVVALDDLSYGDPSNLETSLGSKNLTFVKGDMNDSKTVKETLKDIEVVFHEDSIVSVPLSLKDPELTYKVNVNGTRNLLMNIANSSVKKFVFASSAAVYGNCQDLPLKTTSPTIPISPYGASKLEGEKLCLEAYKSTGLGTTVLRYFNAYGPRSSTGGYSSVVNRFMERLAKLEAPVITGNGEATRDFIYVKDIARANILAASNSNSSGKIYNVATGTRVTMNELANLEVKILIGPNLVIPFEYKPREREDIVHSYADVAATELELEFRAYYSLEKGLTEYFQTLWPVLPLPWQKTMTRA
jgi:UDP-glucose 4-epimerase